MKFIFGLQGRFGNHFYILSAMIYTMKKYNIECFLYLYDYIYKDDYYIKYFSNNIINDIPNNVIIDEEYDNYIEYFIQKYKDTDNIIYLQDKYFQYNKYFLEYKEYIKNIFIINNQNIIKYKNKISNNDVFISVRRGDYFDYNFYVLNSSYYIDMYNKYFSGKNIYISSDDIDWCKEHLIINNFINCPNIYYLENLYTTELYTIGTFFTNYICANSTFSSACELSSDNIQYSIGISNISNYYNRINMFSKNCLLYNIEDNKYRKYIEINYENL